WSAQIRRSFSLRDVSGTESRGRPRTRGRDRGAVRLRLAWPQNCTQRRARLRRAGPRDSVERSSTLHIQGRDDSVSLDLGEHAQEIAAEDFLDVGFGEAALEQTFGNAGESCRGLQVVGQRRNTIEVAADAGVLDACDFDRMQNVVDDILEL